MINMTELEAPNGWHWGIGNKSDSYYTYWLYTDSILYQDGKFGWECQIYWDEGHKHSVSFNQYTKLKQDGDPEYGYPEHTAQFETEKEAVEYAVRKATELR